MSFNPVSTPVQPNYNGDQPGSPQTGSGYPMAIDAAIRAMARVGWMFTPYQSSPLAMTVTLAAGFVYGINALTEVAAQTTGTITAPVSNPRIDRVVIDAFSGVVSVITGAEGSSPSPPALTSGVLPVAQVTLQVSSAVITNAMITDERAVWISGSGDNFSTNYAHVREQQTANTASSDTITATNWIKRTLNTTVTNILKGASLASSQLTLAAGIYLAMAKAPAVGTSSNGIHKLRLRDATHSVTLATGPAVQVAGANGMTMVSLGPVQFTLAASSAIEVDQWCTAGSPSGGTAAGTGQGEVEVYAELVAWRVG